MEEMDLEPFLSPRSKSRFFLVELVYDLYDLDAMLHIEINFSSRLVAC